MSIRLQILDSGDSALYCRLGEDISPVLNREVYALERFLSDLNLDGIIEFVPSYTGLMVYYNPLVAERENLCSKIMAFENRVESEEEEFNEFVLTIPVIYGGEYGPDLSHVAKTNGISVKEVISIHSKADYLTYMIGFTPGFPYLGGMDKRIACARRDEPRVKIPAGSVGIAGDQTGIYPIESPGGWQIIGKTPVGLFNPDLENPFIIEPGLYLKFREIDRVEFESIEVLVKAGAYAPEIERRQR